MNPQPNPQVGTTAYRRNIAAADQLTPDLWLECPHCHELNDPRLDFCGECRSLLALTPSGSWYARCTNTYA